MRLLLLMGSHYRILKWVMTLFTDLAATDIEVPKPANVQGKGGREEGVNESKTRSSVFPLS